MFTWLPFISSGKGMTLETHPTFKIAYSQFGSMSKFVFTLVSQSRPKFVGAAEPSFRHYLIYLLGHEMEPTQEHMKWRQNAACVQMVDI